jgi:hypothetical protein
MELMEVIIFNEINKRNPIIMHLLVHLEQGFLLLFFLKNAYIKYYSVLQSATKTESNSG